jgi:hypothetical protein
LGGPKRTGSITLRWILGTDTLYVWQADITASGLCSVVNFGIFDALLNMVFNSKRVKNVACVEERRYE